ncbi:hypothetical protein V8E54_005328 [Elaphomyces granulatus]
MVRIFDEVPADRTAWNNCVTAPNLQGRTINTFTGMKSASEITQEQFLLILKVVCNIYMEYPIIGDTVYTEWIEGRNRTKRVRPLRARAIYDRDTGIVRAVGTHPGPDGKPGGFVRAAEHSSANATNQGTFSKWFLDI